jgi:hypothetical protein
LAAFGWSLLALLALFLGLWFGMDAAFRHLPLWLCADRYVAAELEVTYLTPPREHRSGRTSPRTIEGVIHPGGERVQTSTRDITVSQFVPPDERVEGRVALPGEVEGRRLEVWHWPGHAALRRWWHPPTVVMPGATRTGGAAVRSGLIAAAFGVAAVYCFRRGWRHVKASVPPGAEGGTDWGVIAILVLLYVGVLGLLVYLWS